MELNNISIELFLMIFNYFSKSRPSLMTSSTRSILLVDRVLLSVFAIGIKDDSNCSTEVTFIISSSFFLLLKFCFMRFISDF